MAGRSCGITRMVGLNGVQAIMSLLYSVPVPLTKQSKLINPVFGIKIFMPVKGVCLNQD